MTEFLQLLIYGVIHGGVIAVGAIGLTLTFGILRFPNFAHGDTLTLGAYFALMMRAGFGWPLWLALLASMVLTAVCSAAIDRAIYRPLRIRGSVTLLIASIGVALIIRNLIRFFWGPSLHFYTQGIQFPIRFYGLRIRPDHLLILGVCAALVVGVHLFLRKSKIGKAMRAMADNPVLARVSGIDTERVILWTWLIGSGLAAAAGVLMGLDTQVYPDLGWNLLLSIFAAVILGGIGSPYGAMAGGMIIGVSQELSTAVISTAYKPAVSFVILIAILLLRPQGLFRTAKGVRA